MLNYTIEPKHYSQNTSVYFPNLNGVRFFACMSVMIHHIEQAKLLMGLPNAYGFYLIKNMGKLGVELFFVLSGFLITYLLLAEKGQSRTVSVKKFYVRRILRIWPIYFLVGLLSFFVFPAFPLFQDANASRYYFDPNFYSRSGFFTVVFPNVAMILYNLPYLCAQTWSVGVEEQFYLLWPWVIRANSRQQRLRVIGLFTLLLAALLTLMIVIADRNPSVSTSGIKPIVVFFFGQFRILTMVIGGIGAYLVYHQKKAILDVLFRPAVQWIVYSLLLALILSGTTFPGMNAECYAVFFCFFIVNVAANPRSIINLEQRLVSYLGKISYGIYMYHVAVTVACINAIRMMLGQQIAPALFNGLLYVGTIGGTVAVAALSYTYFEQPFLQLKKRFEVRARLDIEVQTSSIA